MRRCSILAMPAGPALASAGPMPLRKDFKALRCSSPKSVRVQMLLCVGTVLQSVSWHCNAADIGGCWCGTTISGVVSAISICCTVSSTLSLLLGFCKRRVCDAHAAATTAEKQQRRRQQKGTRKSTLASPARARGTAAIAAGSPTPLIAQFSCSP